MRVGIGWDVHPFDPGRALVLGGVRIDGTWGLRGHSDADALLHAIADAMLGAATLGDLGEHFPDGDPQWRGAPSAVLLGIVHDKVKAAGFELAHVDVTVIAERPRVAPHRAAMRARIAEILGLALEHVSVKASSANGVGSIGRAEGVAALAVVSLVDAAGRA